MANIITVIYNVTIDKRANRTFASTEDEGRVLRTKGTDLIYVVAKLKERAVTNLVEKIDAEVETDTRQPARADREYKIVKVHITSKI